MNKIRHLIQCSTSLSTHRGIQYLHNNNSNNNKAFARVSYIPEAHYTKRDINQGWLSHLPLYNEWNEKLSHCLSTHDDGRGTPKIPSYFPDEKAWQKLFRTVYIFIGLYQYIVAPWWLLQVIANKMREVVLRNTCVQEYNRDLCDSPSSSCTAYLLLLLVVVVVVTITPGRV